MTKEVETLVVVAPDVPVGWDFGQTWTTQQDRATRRNPIFARGIVRRALKAQGIEAKVI